MGVGVGTQSAMKRDIGFEASWVGPSAEGVAYLMVFPWDIDNFDVELAEKFVPTTAAADGTDNLVEVFRIPMLETSVVCQHLDVHQG